VDYRLLLTQRAIGDLAGIVGHIARDDGDAASRFGEALLDHVDLLRQFPHIGNVVGKRSRVRKLVHSPILAYYRIHEEQRLVEVLHFRHGSRKPLKLRKLILL
jgi:plasmid stabilization system protein ParE